MKLKVINNVSAACFFLSSASLMSIPFLNNDHAGTTAALLLALLFWMGLLIGTALQLFLWGKTRGLIRRRNLKIAKTVAVISFLVATFAIGFVLHYFETNGYALTVNLFVLLFSAEMFFMIKRKEILE